jgi:hypothetical protein
MRTYITLFLMMIVSLLNAQNIMFKGCIALFEDRTYNFNKTGTDATGRNIYTTTPVDGVETCGGLGTCEFKLQWSTTNSRWEFLADEGNGTFTTPYLIYTNTSNSLPNPPSINLGIWLENTLITMNKCGGNLTNSNATLTGSVQDNTLGNQEFIAKNNTVAIYPNPANEMLNIRSNDPIKSIEIVTIQGQTIVSYNYSKDYIDISSLHTGIYLAKIKVNEEVHFLNFIKR